MSSSRGWPPYDVAPPGDVPEWLKVQAFPQSIFAVLGIDSHTGYRPMLSPYVFPVVPIELEQATTGTTGLQGAGFIGGQQSQLNAGFVAHVQLFNPAGSGRQVIVDRMLAMLTVSQNLHVRRHDVALATLSTQLSAKEFGAAAPLAELRTQNNVAAQGTVISEIAVVGGAAPLDVLGGVPIVLSEGQGVLVNHNGTGVGVFAQYEWRELIV